MTSFVIQCALEKAKKIQNSSTWPISYVLISAKVRNQFPVYNLKTFSAQLWFLFSSVPIRLVLSNESSIHQRWRKFYQTLPYFYSAIYEFATSLYSIVPQEHYKQWSLIRLSNHLHGHYSQCYFVHRHLNNVWYNKAHSLIGKPYLAIIVNIDYIKFLLNFCDWICYKVICYWFREYIRFQFVSPTLIPDIFVVSITSSRFSVYDSKSYYISPSPRSNQRQKKIPLLSHFVGDWDGNDMRLRT